MGGDDTRATVPTFGTTKATTTTTERTPLLVVRPDHGRDVLGDDNGEPDENDVVPQQQRRSQGQASVQETVLNQMKTCMGTGTLALSYSCQQSGLVAYTVGMILIATWNVYCTDRLVNCLRYLPDHDPPAKGGRPVQRKVKFDDGPVCASSDEHDDEEEVVRDIVASPTSPSPPTVVSSSSPPPGTSQLGQVAFAAYGYSGLQVLDVLMVILLHGIIVSYVCAAVSFLDDTNLVPTVIKFVFRDAKYNDDTSTPTSSSGINAALSASLMWTMSLVPDMGHLSRASAIGLAVLLMTFAIIAGYGFANVVSDEGFDDTIIPLVPHSAVGLARWFGVVVFSMGTVPLTYNFRQSMRQPRHIMTSTHIALALVATLYLVMGIGLLLLFPHLTGDVLHELPIVMGSTAATNASLVHPVHVIVPLVARLAMVSVVIMTAPLLVVPCGELVEGKLFHRFQQVRHASPHRHHHHHHHWSWIAVTRAVICGLCAVIATAFPSFVQVLSVVGSACVGTVSFVLPPLFHRRLLVLLVAQGGNRHATDRSIGCAGSRSACVDLCMLALGITATLLATVLSVRGG